MNQVVESKIGGQRLASISAVRFIAMLMIIICHLFQFYGNELSRWFNIGVQIFFVISGFLYGTKHIDNPISFIKKSFIKILTPYYLFLLISFLLYFIFYPQDISLKTSIKAVFCAGTIPGLGHLWFVGYILLCYLITPYLYWIRKSIQPSMSEFNVVLLYVSLVVLLQIVGVLFDSYFKPDRTSCYVIGFFSADLINRYGNKFKSWIICLFSMLAIITNTIEIVFKYIVMYEFQGVLQVLFLLLCKFAHLFLGIALFLLLNEALKKVDYWRLLKISDKYSYHVYIVHALFILSPFTLMTLTSVNLLNWLIVLVAIFCSGVLLQKIESKLLL